MGPVTKAIPSKPGKSPAFTLDGHTVQPGRRRDIDLRVARLASGSWTHMPVVVLHGARPGPTVWVSGAVHGDELNGVEIVRQIIRSIDPQQLSGTVLAVPIVNVFGVTTESRYLPDRRDLNRSFPGSKRGSLAARVAHLFFDGVVSRCSVGLDFHTGSGGRSNYPQIRCNVDDGDTLRLATRFGAPLIMHANLRDGSLRGAAAARGIPVLLFEGGEAHRFDTASVTAAVDGTFRVFGELGMIEGVDPAAAAPPMVSRKSRWMRAGRTGFAHLLVELGDSVEQGQPLASVSDSIGRSEAVVRSRSSGVVIGILRTAHVHRGDALVHVAELEDPAP